MTEPSSWTSVLVVVAVALGVGCADPAPDQPWERARSAYCEEVSTSSRAAALNVDLMIERFSRIPDDHSKAERRQEACIRIHRELDKLNERLEGLRRIFRVLRKSGEMEDGLFLDSLLDAQTTVEIAVNNCRDEVPKFLLSFKQVVASRHADVLDTCKKVIWGQ